MPIEKALNFQNEADFTSRFLVPLLRRLGYLIVAEYHGQREFGKDLVFGEIDRFGEVAYHGLQAKYQDSVSQSDSEKLIDDCHQAFRNPFRHPNTGAEHRVNTFVVANAGSITDNARTNFFTAATNSEHGGNVRMFDGKALLALDRWATVNRVEQVGETLSGLQIELRFNHVLLVGIVERLNKYIAAPDDPSTSLPIERLRVTAASHFIRRPILPAQIDVNLVNSYLFDLESINTFLERIGAMGPKAHRIIMSREVVTIAASAISHSDTIDRAVLAALASLGPLAAV